MDKISAFMDGEANRFEARQTISRVEQDAECGEIWKTFHLIGDVMRGDVATLGEEFSARFHTSMEREPTQLAPRVQWRKARNYALSAAASVAAVAVVLTLLVTDNPLQPQAQIATAPQSQVNQIPQSTAQPQPVAAANQERVNEYLMAHQEYSPSTALQGVALYVRTVSVAQDEGGR